jgi:hypothetical protein
MDAQTVRIFELDVVPWLAHSDGAGIEVGDLVRIDSSHFNFWDPADGSSGFSGAARVLGRQLGVTDYAMRLVVAVAGVYTTHTLAPAAAVLNFDHATVTTWIDVSSDYYALFNSYDEGSGFDLVVYKPSYDDATTQSYGITAVSEVGGNCRLTVGSIVGAPTLTTDHFLTLPVRGSISPLVNQAQHMFVDSETIWL